MSLFSRRVHPRLSVRALARPWYQSTRGCTDIYVVSDDGSPVHGRTIEFGLNLGRDLAVHPPENAYNYLSPFSELDYKGFSTDSSRYGYFAMNGNFEIGASGESVGISADGVNEKGLSVGCLYLPGYAQFEYATKQVSNKCIASVMLVDYLLGNFATTEQILADIQDKCVWDLAQLKSETESVLPIHWVIYDADQRGIVLEWVGGKLNVHESIGVFTNSPPYPHHVEYVQNFSRSLTPVNPEGTAVGQGFGMFGLPGDWTAQSRFLRTYVQREWLTSKSTAAETINSVCHIINTVDLVKGIALERKKDASPDADPLTNPKAFASDTTQVSLVKDLSNNRLFYRCYDSLNWGLVDLDFDALRGMAGTKPYTLELPQYNPTDAIDPLGVVGTPMKPQLLKNY